ncbi:MAG: protein-L-isoaspartate(D-aspartate) O-methyltransferase [Deltaproteobacteria bacterium]|nr:protein-L-isoaspartate(D-aspartate) O-methyltransferase [Deltaproteobacteria bacterium]
MNGRTSITPRQAAARARRVQAAGTIANLVRARPPVRGERRLPELLLPLLLSLLLGCTPQPSPPSPPPPPLPQPSASRAADGAPPHPAFGERVAERRAMVHDQLAARDIADPRVLAALERVPRHHFVRPGEQRQAYRDHPLPIGLEQTISQPYIVAFMTQALRLGPGERVLEIGTGSGYQAAVLAELGLEVYTIEIVPELAERARRACSELGYRNIRFRAGDGYRGWPEAAPFAAIMVTAAPDHVPPALLEQLGEGGRLVLPLGSHFQELVRLEKQADWIVRERLLPVRFVPMTGEAMQPRQQPVRPMPAAADPP